MMKYDLKVGIKLVLKREINQCGIYIKKGTEAIVDKVDLDDGMVRLKIKGRGKIFGTIREILEYFELSEKENSKKYNVVNVNSDIKTILHDGKTTVVILHDDTVGVSHCLRGDTYNKEVGERVAYIKAKIKSLQNELEQY